MGDTVAAFLDKMHFFHQNTASDFLRGYTQAVVEMHSIMDRVYWGRTIVPSKESVGTITSDNFQKVSTEDVLSRKSNLSKIVMRTEPLFVLGQELENKQGKNILDESFPDLPQGYSGDLFITEKLVSILGFGLSDEMQGRQYAMQRFAQASEISHVHYYFEEDIDADSLGEISQEALFEHSGAFADAQNYVSRLQFAASLIGRGYNPEHALAQANQITLDDDGEHFRHS